MTLCDICKKKEDDYKASGKKYYRFSCCPSKGCVTNKYLPCNGCKHEKENDIDEQK